MKKVLAEQLGFSIKNPLLSIILDRELSKSDEENLKHILEATAAVDVQVVVLADTNLDACDSPHAVVLPYGRVNRTKLLQGADMALCFGFNDVEEMLLNGTIPVSPARSEIADYNPNRETGNAFVYKKMNCWSMFAALVRAVETFKFPYDWTNIVRQGRESTAKESAEV